MRRDKCDEVGSLKPNQTFAAIDVISISPENS
jgi:hypothetical protein